VKKKTKKTLEAGKNGFPVVAVVTVVAADLRVAVVALPCQVVRHYRW
jgi:hypothetical protein